MEAKTIERIAEELGVNFYDLAPLIIARDEFHRKEGRREVVEIASKFEPKIHKGVAIEVEHTPQYGSKWKWKCDDDCPLCLWQAKLKEWDIE